jgi:hypothetical protein
VTRFFSTCVILTFGTAACGSNGPVDRQASNTAGLPSINARAPSASGEPHVKTAPANAGRAQPASMKIPAALQGRWGLTPADCTTALGDAKGLMVINSDELRFYESRAVPAGDVAADANSISGNFSFTGEGQRWTKYEALKVQNHGLVRTEMNPTASFTYAKCS